MWCVSYIVVMIIEFSYNNILLVVAQGTGVLSRRVMISKASEL